MYKLLPLSASILVLIESISGLSTPFHHRHHHHAARIIDITSRSSRNILQARYEGDDFPPEEESVEYTGSVDWDAEWKKVVQSEGKLQGGTERPGKNFYKSEAEIAAIKAANRAAETAAQVGSKVGNSLPDIRSLSGDWKFWIAILAIISVGLTFLTAPPMEMLPADSGSYYI